MFHSAGMLARDGRCKTLDSSSDGYVRGESCAGVVLSNSEGGAAGSGSTSTVVVCGSAVNQDGRSSSLTAPNGPAQQSVMRAAVRQAAATTVVHTLQMHGTGTALGDPIEVGASSAVLGAQVGAIVLSAGKTCIGHTEPAAGISGIVHAMTAMSSATVHPLLHLTQVNPHLEGILSGQEQAKSRFMLARSAAPRAMSETQSLEGCGVSSFAFQGTNAHGIVGVQPFQPLELASMPKAPWRREYFWVVPMPHALQTRASPDMGFTPTHKGSVSLETRLDRSFHTFLWDHRVGGKVLFPGAGYMEMMNAACATVLIGPAQSRALVQGSISAPLVLPDLADAVAEPSGTAVSCRVELQDGAVRISSQADAARHSTLHMGASARALAAEADKEAVSGLPSLESQRCTSVAPTSSPYLYSQMAAAGLQYGPKFSLLSQIRSTSDKSASTGRLSAADGSQEGYGALPSALDSCLHLVATLSQSEGKDAEVPVGMDAYVCWGGGAGAAEMAASGSTDPARQGCSDYGLALLSGQCVSYVRHLLRRPVGSVSAVQSGHISTGNESLYSIVWKSSCPARRDCFWRDRVNFDVGDHGRSSTSLCTNVTAALQGLISKASSVSVDIQFLSQGVTPASVAPFDDMCVLAAPLSGLMRTLSQEYSHCTSTGLDVSMPSFRVFGIEPIFRRDGVESSNTGLFEGQGMAERGQYLTTPQLSISRVAKSETRIPMSGAVIQLPARLTGGNGSLGNVVASWLLQGLVGRLHVFDRTGRARFIDGGKSNAEISAARCDLNFSEEIKLSTNTHRYGILVHTEGVVQDAILANQKVGTIRQVFSPKCGEAVLGALEGLGMAPQSAPALLFSSTASMLGSPGQSNFSSANAVLDSFAWSSSARGVPICSVQWGAWATSGMEASAATVRKLMQSGVRMLSPSQGMKALSRIMSRPMQRLPSPILCANDFDWELILGNSKESPELLSGLRLPDRSSDPGALRANAGPVPVEAGIFAGLSPSERRDAITTQIESSVEGVVGKKVGVNEPLMDSGLDSLGAVELSNSIAKVMGLELSSTFTIDYPTISAMVEYVDSTYELQPGKDIVSLTSSVKPGGGVPHRNAFFGRMSANTLEEQTTVLLKDNVSRVPYDRWDFSYIDCVEDAATAPRFGVFMENVSKFDPRSFNIVPAEALYTDPQQRMLLLHSSAVLSGVADKQIGSYISFVSSDYSTLASTHDVPVNAFSFSGTASSVASGRVSFCFGLKGPAMSVDVACAGSLVTAHAAHTSIRAGVVGSCITGGIMLNLVWSTTFILHQGGFLAADGRCKTMDADADGYARGEACRVLLLHDEEGTGNVMLAGTAANHSGTCSTLTAPNGPSQQAVIHKALVESAAMGPSAVHALQMHANGTSLGDPIEIGASIGVLQEGRGENNPLVLLSQKGRTGHQEAAAGAVLMTAAWSAAMSQSAASFLHLRTLNPFVAAQFDKTALQVAVPRCMQRMGPARKDIAIGVSSFAAQGTNAHVVIAGDILGGPKDLLMNHPTNMTLKRYWITAAASPLVYRNVACQSNRWTRQAKMVLEGRMTVRELAPYWQMSLGGRVIAPSGMLLFAGGAAVNVFTDSVAARPVGVQDVTFCNPVTLPQKVPEASESVRMLISLSSTGQLLGTVENGGDNEHGDPRRMEREDLMT